jgi:hypothetical protein
MPVFQDSVSGRVRGSNPDTSGLETSVGADELHVEGPIPTHGDWRALLLMQVVVPFSALSAFSAVNDPG